MYAQTQTGFNGPIADFFANLLNPGREQAMDYASSVADQTLSAQAAAQAKVIHQQLIGLQAARDAGDLYQAQQYQIGYNASVDAYNTLVQELQQLEGPNAVWVTLAKLPDVASAGLDHAVNDALDKLSGVAKGVGLYVLLPIVGLALALIWVAGKSGAVQVRKVV